MTIEKDDILNSILKSLSRIDYVHPGDIPNIDLYMDQVTTFMDTQLHSTKRYEDDKILTKTMINNYVKNNLFPPPQKKKYSREHLLFLIFIYYFKNILSIKDIEALLKPLNELYENKASGKAEDGEPLDMTAVYKEICAMCKSEIGTLQDSVTASWNRSADTFADIDGEKKEELNRFAFICSLSFDVYVKKLLIEKMIDEFSDDKKD